MKRLIIFLCSLELIAFVFLSGCASSLCEKPGEILYTTHNIWYGRRTNALDALNYKSGSVLPAGTEVQLIKCGTRHKARVGRTSDAIPLYHIDFRPLNADVQKDFRIFLNRTSYPNITIQQYKDRLLSTKKFEDLVEGFTEVEIQAIKEGIIVPGMSKEAVLVSFGHPSKANTPDLNSNIWVFWEGITKKFIVEFDNTGLTISDLNFNK